MKKSRFTEEQMVAILREADKAPERIGSAFTALLKTRPDALIAAFDFMLGDQRTKIASLGITHKIPVFSLATVFADSGALLAYGVPLQANYGRVAAYVKRILAGARPADLPVEQPTNFELVINLKTAKAINITIPPSFLLRADRVIE